MKFVALTCLLVIACAAEPSDEVAGDNLGDESGGGGGKDDSYGLSGRTCAAGATTQGIDVSYFQGTIDWSAVHAAGIEFAFIRLSYGDVFRDPKFDRNWPAAKAAGVVRGAYQFFRPSDDVASQADMMIEAIGTYEPGDLPPVLDVEKTDGYSPAQIASRVRTWVDRVHAALGVEPIIYTGSYFWRDHVGGAKGYDTDPLWIAQYTSQCPNLPLPWHAWAFWQHSNVGRIAGITGRVDLDTFDGSVADLRTFAGSAY